MTDKELFAKVRALGLTISKRDGEYRVNFKGASEGPAYYTDDKDDALGTAQDMATRRDYGNDPMGAWHGRNE